MSKQHLRDHFRETGLTQAELAAALGISQGYLSRLLSGESVPSLAMAVRLAHATGVPIASFLPHREDDSTRSKASTAA